VLVAQYPTSLTHEWWAIGPTGGVDLEVYVHHEAGRSNDPHYLACKDFVITTYNTLASEARPYLEWATECAKGHYSDKPGEPLAAIFRVHWHRVILDEASYIKNPLTAFAKSVKLLRATHRWCITGTPIQNSLNDLFSLLQFLQHKPYDEKWQFTKAFVPPKGARLVRLQSVLKAVCLRRTKTSTVEGKSILSLPDREMEDPEDSFSPEEHDYYQAIETASQLKFSVFVKRGTVRKNYANALLLLLRLRQCCDHPLLTQTTTEGENVRASQVDSVTDIDGSKAILNPDGSLPEVSWKGMKPKAAAAPAPADPTSIIPKDVLTRINAEGVNPECPICLDLIRRHSSSVTPCGHAFCKTCIAQYCNDKRSAGAVTECPMCRKPLKMEELISALHVMPAMESSLDLSDDEDDEEVAALAASDYEKLSVRKKIKFLEAKAKQSMAFFQRAGGMAVSTKIAKLIAILEVELDKNPRVKCLVFSQWTSMLDLVEEVMTQKLCVCSPCTLPCAHIDVGFAPLAGRANSGDMTGL